MKKLLWILAILFMFSMNILAIYLPLNGLSTGDLSDKLTTLITPAGFTFAIRSVIYIGVLIISYLFLANKTTLPDKTIRWFIISCIANGLWIIAWHYENLHLSMILMLVLLGSLIVVDQSIKNLKDLKYYQIIRNSILLYFGWVQVASLLMTTIYLIYQLKWIDNQTIWRPLTVLTLAWLINIAVIWKEKNFMTMLVFLWALFGIRSAGAFQYMNW